MPELVIPKSEPGHPDRRRADCQRSDGGVRRPSGSGG